MKSLLAELLENGSISEACRVATEFTLYSQDLAIILVGIWMLLVSAIAIFIQNFPLHTNLKLLHGPSMFADKAKIYGVLCNQSSFITLMKHLVIGQH